MKVAVSVIVATYASGDTIERVIASLDAQTMPAADFEAIFVDDGSPDDTVERLRAHAATRPNMQVIASEHSGWPSRPRNIGVDAARGEYVLFMDHDDSLYPDGLRRAYEFALEHDSDVVNAKESNTADVWWAMDSLSAGNIENAHDENGVSRLQELTPHKLYRRSLLREHDIRFPEARRSLWEDWYVNVPAYRHGAVVSTLADTPVYHWHVGANNTTRTFDCAREDYWDRLEDLFDLITTTLAGDRFAQDRLELIAYNVRLRVIQRVARLLNRREPPTAESAQMAFGRARRLLEQYGTPEVLAQMSRKHLAFAHLFEHGTVEQVLAFERVDRSVQAGAELRDYRWEDSKLLLETTTTWRATQPSLATFDERDGRLRLRVGPELSAMIPPDLLELSDELEHLRSDLALRDRFDHVTWALPFRTEPAGAVLNDKSNVAGSTHITQQGHSAIDLATAACGHPLPDAVWDLRLRTVFYGIERTPAVATRAGRLAAAVGSRAAIVYRNKWRNFSLDLAQELRTLAVDAVPVVGQIGPISDFSVTLSALQTSGTGRIPSMLVAVPAGGEPTAVADAAFSAEVVVDERGARLQGHGELAAGDYHLHARQRDGLKPTGYGLTVNPMGDAQLIATSD